MEMELERGEEGGGGQVRNRAGDECKDTVGEFAETIQQTHFSRYRLFPNPLSER